jgi:hypothetical protein
MTRIIIDDVHDQFSLVHALSAVRKAFRDGRAFEKEETSFSRFDILLEAGDGIAVIDGVRVRRLEAAEPDRGGNSKVNGQDATLMPCPSRGTHRQLTDCWSCWSDVMRGAALEPEVLAAAAWHSDSAGEDQ